VKFGRPNRSSTSAADNMDKRRELAAMVMVSLVDGFGDGLRNGHGLVRKGSVSDTALKGCAKVDEIIFGHAL
jgi:hypothetical protein